MPERLSPRRRRRHRPWLLSDWEPTCQPADVTPFECERVYGAPPTPLPSPLRQEAESGPSGCLVSSASRPPQRVDGERGGSAEPDGSSDFSLCDTSAACHVASPPARAAQPSLRLGAGAACGRLGGRRGVLGATALCYFSDPTPGHRGDSGGL